MTIKRIAKLANVSSATVSKVMNGKDENISEPTRQRILKIIEEEGYIPNGVAKSLKVRKTKTIGIILPDVMNLFYSELVRGGEDMAEANGYSIIICNTDNKIEKELKYLQILQEKMVDGIVMTATESSGENTFERFKTPLVLVDRDIDFGNKVGRIVVDNMEPAYEATKHLIAKGCKKIALISSVNSNKPSVHRYKGYEKALLEAGQAIDENLIYLDKFSIESGYEGTMKVLHDPQVDGIFCGNDLIAIGAIKAIKEKGKRIPEDIKIVGFDDIAISQYINPPLTTIKQPIYQMGREAVDMLVDIIEAREVEMKKVLKAHLVERQST